MLRRNAVSVDEELADARVLVGQLGDGTEVVVHRVELCKIGDGPEVRLARIVNLPQQHAQRLGDVLAGDEHAGLEAVTGNPSTSKLLSVLDAVAAKERLTRLACRLVRHLRTQLDLHRVACTNTGQAVAQQEVVRQRLSEHIPLSKVGQLALGCLAVRPEEVVGGLDGLIRRRVLGVLEDPIATAQVGVDVTVDNIRDVLAGLRDKVVLFQEVTVQHLGGQLVDVLAHPDSVLPDGLRQLAQNLLLQSRVGLGEVRLDLAHDVDALKVARRLVGQVPERGVDLRLKVLEDPVGALDLRLDPPLHAQAPFRDLPRQEPAIPREGNGVRKVALEDTKFVRAAGRCRHPLVQQVVNAAPDLVDLAVRGCGQVPRNSGLANRASACGQRTLDRAPNHGGFCA